MSGSKIKKFPVRYCKRIIQEPIKNQLAMRNRKTWGSISFAQLSLRPFIRRSREIISQLEEPFYRTNNPMAYAIIAGVILGCFIFVLVSGKNIFSLLH